MVYTTINDSSFARALEWITGHHIHTHDGCPCDCQEIPQKSLEKLEAQTVEDKHCKVSRSLFVIYVIGKVLGILPFYTVRCSNGRYCVKFDWRSLSTLYSVTMLLPTVLLSFLEVFEIARALPSLDRFDFGEYLLTAIYFIHISGVRIFFLLKAKDILAVFDAAKLVERSLSYYRYSIPDRFVIRARLISVIGQILILVGLINLYLESYAKISSCCDFFVTFSRRYENSFQHETWFGISMAIYEPFLFLTWHYAEISLLVLSFCLREIFSNMNDLINSADPYKITTLDVEFLRHQHRVLSSFIVKTNEAFSPLILWVYGCNFFYLIGQMFVGVYFNITYPELLIQWKTIYGFFLQMTLLLLPSVVASQLNEEAHEALTIIRSWPSLKRGHSSQQTLMRIAMMNRFTIELQNPEISLSGIYFNLNRTFIVGLIGALISYKLMLVEFEMSYETRK